MHDKNLSAELSGTEVKKDKGERQRETEKDKDRERQRHRKAKKIKGNEKGTENECMVLYQCFITVKEDR